MTDRLTTKREPARIFRDLIVWKKAREFVLCVYRYTQKFPKDELFGLTRNLDEQPFWVLTPDS
ncbi:MAG: four helix bundle protein [bacterium]